jgi:hypothetical protein
MDSECCRENHFGTSCRIIEFGRLSVIIKYGPIKFELELKVSDSRHGGLDSLQLSNLTFLVTICPKRESAKENDYAESDVVVYILVQH